MEYRTATQWVKIMYRISGVIPPPLYLRPAENHTKKQLERAIDGAQKRARAQDTLI